MTTRNWDFYGHATRVQGENTLAAAAVGTTTAGTIAGTTAAGAAPTVTNVSASDMGGTFTLNPVTGGGAQAAGAVATVTFAQSFPIAPKEVAIDCYDVTTATAPSGVAAYATSITSAGFSVTCNTLTTAHNYRITFFVIP